MNRSNDFLASTPSRPAAGATGSRLALARPALSRPALPRLALAAALVAGLAGLAACGTVPPDNSALTRARSDYQAAQADAQTQSLAATELRQASDALAQADAAQQRRDDPARVTQLAYLASQRVALASATGQRKGAEAQVAEASAARDQMRLAARTREADQATRDAASATRDAQSATRDAQAAQRSAALSQQQAQASQQQAQAAQQQAGDAKQRAAMLEQQLRELDARKTDRGLVVTIGDVLFDTGRADLRSGGMQNLQRLATFLKTYPQRKAAIEGYTDSTGSDALNLALSSRRAEAVMTALLSQGVTRDQLQTQGYGETHPVAGNTDAAGRQANRRVEVLLSDEQGRISPR